MHRSLHSTADVLLRTNWLTRQFVLSLHFVTLIPALATAQPYPPATPQFGPPPPAVYAAPPPVPPPLVVPRQTGGDDGPLTPPPLVPRDTRFQVTRLTGDGDDLGITELDLRTSLHVMRWKGFSITPMHSSNFFSGGDQQFLPGAVHSDSIEFAYRQAINPEWAYEVAVAPGLYTDYNAFNSDAFRLTGRVLAFWNHFENAQFAFGIVYLDREDIAALPAAGLIYSPTPDLRVELIFPRPRLLYRIEGQDLDSTWIYLSGEFGGGSWAVERQIPERIRRGVVTRRDQEDVLTYSDLRLIGGIEYRWDVHRVFAEVGYVFGREIEFQSDIGSFDPDDTFMIRAGIAW